MIERLVEVPKSLLGSAFRGLVHPRNSAFLRGDLLQRVQFAMQVDGRRNLRRVRFRDAGLDRGLADLPRFPFARETPVPGPTRRSAGPPEGEDLLDRGSKGCATSEDHGVTLSTIDGKDSL